MSNLKYEIFGDDLQALEVQLKKDQTIRSESGTMLYMQDGVEMKTSTNGGLMSGLKRVVTGESFFITNFTNNSSEDKKVAFAAPYPGKIIKVNLEDVAGEEFLCQKDSFLCSEDTVDVSVAFTKKLGAGFFGGAGFILQKLKGEGNFFIHAGGTIVEKTLEKGETLKVDTGCLVGMESTIDYDIQFVGGIKNALFGGEGLFLAKLTGPGKVYLQSLPFSRIVDSVLSVSGR